MKQKIKVDWDAHFEKVMLILDDLQFESDKNDEDLMTLEFENGSRIEVYMNFRINLNEQDEIEVTCTGDVDAEVLTELITRLEAL